VPSESEETKGERNELQTIREHLLAMVDEVSAQLSNGREAFAEIERELQAVKRQLRRKGRE